ncbi:DUF2000 domain-containing protein [Kordia jejudonensis]|uniref:DUF2000 domain-containing protein n=1 Tax=Kordia jejudonensis TaxID=1348245 RepID=UPI00069C9CA6|nr:DUF2000 domain-containing protein [Kordia jejudonensis]
MYSNNNKKFVVVLNKKIEMPKLINAVGHITAGLVSLIPDKAEMKFIKYENGSGGLHPAISEYPYIVLKAKNGNQIRSLRFAAQELGILTNDFVDTMIGISAEAQLNQTIAKKDEELDYWALVMFGDANDINPLTKKFSLFK